MQKSYLLVAIHAIITQLANSSPVAKTAITDTLKYTLPWADLTNGVAQGIPLTPPNPSPEGLEAHPDATRRHLSGLQAIPQKNKQGVPKAPYVGWVWETKVLGTQEKIRFKVDFSSTYTIVGVKNLTGFNGTNWGISNCSNKTNCVQASTYQPNANITYFSKTFINYNASFPINLVVDKPLAKGAPMPAVQMFTVNKTAFYFYGGNGYGVLGLSPESNYLKHLFEAYTWPKDTLNIYFQVNTINTDLKKIYEHRPGQFNGTQLWFNAPTPKKLHPMGTTQKAVNTSFISWAFQNITLSYDHKPAPAPSKSNTKATLEEKLKASSTITSYLFKNLSVCFAPDSRRLFSLNNQYAYDQFTYAVNYALCGIKYGCNRTADISKGLELKMDLGDGEVFTIKPHEYIVLGENKLNWTIGVDTRLFRQNGTCQGAQVAVGRRFLDKFAATLVVKQDTKTGDFTYSYGLQDVRKSDGGTFWIFVFIGVGVVLLLVVVLVIYFLVCNKGDGEPQYEEEGLDMQDSGSYRGISAGGESQSAST